MKTILAVSVFASLSLPVMSVAASVYEMPAVLVTAERTEAEIRKEPQSAEISSPCRIFPANHPMDAAKMPIITPITTKNCSNFPVRSELALFFSKTSSPFRNNDTFFCNYF